jgi:hypothetical protein
MQKVGGSSVFYNDSYGISMNDVLKYILEGLAVAIAAFFISPKNRKDYKSILLIGFSAALVFFVIDKFAPKVSAGTRQGSGFGIGFGLVGGSGNAGNSTMRNNVIEETYVAETPTSISLNDRVEKYFDYGNSKGNQPLTGTGKPEIVVGTSDFDDTLSTTSHEGFADNMEGFDVQEDSGEGMTEGADEGKPVREGEGFEVDGVVDGFDGTVDGFDGTVDGFDGEIEGFESPSKQTSWYPIGASKFDISAHNVAKY